MRSPFLKLGIACLFLLGITGPAPAQTPKIQVLIITGQNGHDWRATTPVLRKILEDTKRFEVRVTDLLATVDALAARKGLSRAAAISLACAELVERDAKN